MVGKEAPKTAKGSRYSISLNHPEWKNKINKRSDYVFEHVKDGKILLSNSFCEEFQEETLERLGRKTFRTIKDFKETKSAYTTFHDREAFRIEGSGFVDGVKVFLELLNTRRDNCYFDFLAISPEGTSKEDRSFNQFLDSVEFK
jgi:hypothetical protein